MLVEESAAARFLFFLKWRPLCHKELPLRANVVSPICRNPGFAR